MSSKVVTGCVDQTLGRGKFQIWKRVSQGCPLSPWLFTIFIDRIGSEARKKVYGSVRLTTGGIEVCLWMASYTVLVVELGSERSQLMNNRLQTNGIVFSNSTAVIKANNRIYSYT